MPENKKILFLSPYPLHKAPSQRLKYEQYYPFFEKQGYVLTTRTFMDEDLWKIIYKKGFLFSKVLLLLKAYGRRIIDLFSLRRYDVVYVHLWVTPLGLPLFEGLVCLLAKKVVYDIDDMIFLNKGTFLQRAWGVLRGKTKALYLMKHADHVITCTPYLDEKVRTYTSHTTDISSTIDTDLYVPVNRYENEQVVTLGWSGSHSTLQYLELLKEVFMQLRATRTFKLLVIGGDRFTCEGIDVEVVPWSAKDEVHNLQKIDIGLYPLPKNEWVLGKSGLKALQYMALGIPTVATDYGTIHRIIDHGANGFLVNTTQEWIEYLTLLIDDASLRKKTGTAARATVIQQYSLTANASHYLNVVDSLTPKQ